MRGGSKAGGFGYARLAGVFCVALGLSGLISLWPSAGARGAPVTLPDMQLLVPARDFSIGTDPANGHRQLQFTHVTWDAGTGPFEIDPGYSRLTGIAAFTQAVYNSPRSGVWKLDHSVPLAVTGIFEGHDDYRFPLTRFTLNQLNPDGSIGPAVATSPKADYCMTGDTFVGGVPSTPSRTFIPQGNCDNPSLRLGWSVGWGDEYDQTDDGQPINLSGVPDGTYILRGTVDPEHVLTESNPDNNVVDTKLQIAGHTVTVLSQTRPTVTPPEVTLTSPEGGSSVSGTVILQASAAATAPATVTSVQFLLDGQPLGPPQTSPPYTYAWDVGTTTLGTHRLSAQVTDSSGGMSTAPVETVTVAFARSGTPVLDQSLTRAGTGTATTAAFSTAAAGETLVAFAGCDGPEGAGQQRVTVSGAGLSWHRVRQENGRPGDSEIWTASAPARLSGVTVSSKPAKAGYEQFLTVLTFEDAGGAGASAGASAASGAPHVSLTAKAAGSLAFAVGDDYSHAIARTVGPGQALISQLADAQSGDTYWVQGTSTAVSAAGQRVTLDDTAPTADQWNLAAVEVTAASPRPADTVRPTVSMANPVAGQTLSGAVPVAATATDNAALASVQFLLDGKPLGRPVTAPPYAIRWRTTAAVNGTHVLSARATDASGNVTTSRSVTTTVQNPAPPMTCFVMQADVSTHGHGAVTTPSFHTAAAGETLLALVGSNGPAKPGGQAVTVSGAGLHWSLVARANGQYGDAEIWQATASRVLPCAAVTSVPAHPGYDQSLTVIAMEGTGGVGAAAAASAASGAPALRLSTTRPTSLVFAVANDRNEAAAPRFPAGWVSLNRWLEIGSRDTSWSQYTNVPVPAAGTRVTVGDAAPAAGRWDLAAVELTGGD
jgi:Bacterial Ig domain/Lysyl oxidase